MIRRTSLGLAALLAACTSSAQVEIAVEVEKDQAQAPQKKRAQRKLRAEKPAPAADDRTSFALAADIAKALSESSMTRPQALETVRGDWQGKRYRWDVAVSAPLCRLGACNVFPFDHAAAEDRIVQGWLPRLDLSKETHADLVERCGAGLCVATIEATLKTFVLSTEDPTSLTFSDVSVLEVRAPGDKESWVRRRADPRVAKLRTRGAGR